MPGATQTILRKAKIDLDTPLNILTFPTHERYQSNLSRTGHNFYLWQGENIKTWNPQYAELPENHYLLNPHKKNAQLPLYLTIDLILSQNKFGQIGIATTIAQQVQCPLISLEHTLPHIETPHSHLINLKNQRGHENIFISEYSRGKWLWEENEAKIIHHGIDTVLFNDNKLERRPVICSVVNDWINRDYFCGFKLWQQITGHPNPHFSLNVWGSTPGLSDPSYSVKHLVEEYNTSLIYLNTSLISPISTSLLEAMACGCIPISTANCMTPEIIKHGYNGFLSNNPTELKGFVEMVLGDPEKYKEVGINARKTIQNMFGLDKFLTNWNNLFYSVVGN